MKKAALLHTTPVTVAPLKALAERIMPGVEIVNILDDSLLRDVMKMGGPDEAVNSRIASYIKVAEQSGCGALMSACSSIGETIEKCSFLTEMPLLRIDEAMADIAVESGTTIGVMATVSSTLNPTINIIERKARERGREIALTRCLMEDAYKALISGDGEKHDEIVLNNLRELMKTCDVIVLAQASMARVLEKLDNITVPILTSPESGMNRFKDVLERGL
jgi:Asp/Glu/hydantoin racemase